MKKIHFLLGNICWTCLFPASIQNAACSRVHRFLLRLKKDKTHFCNTLCTIAGRCVLLSFCPGKHRYEFWSHFWQYWYGIRPALSWFWRKLAKLELVGFKIKIFTSKMVQNEQLSLAYQFLNLPPIIWYKIIIKSERMM